MTFENENIRQQQTIKSKMQTITIDHYLLTQTIIDQDILYLFHFRFYCLLLSYIFILKSHFHYAICGSVVLVGKPEYPEKTTDLSQITDFIT
jgi:hypothetical protein